MDVESLEDESLYVNTCMTGSYHTPPLAPEGEDAGASAGIYVSYDNDSEDSIGYVDMETERQINKFQKPPRSSSNGKNKRHKSKNAGKKRKGPISGGLSPTPHPHGLPSQAGEKLKMSSGRLGASSCSPEIPVVPMVPSPMPPQIHVPVSPLLSHHHLHRMPAEQPLPQLARFPVPKVPAPVYQPPQEYDEVTWDGNRPTTTRLPAPSPPQPVPSFHVPAESNAGIATPQDKFVVASGEKILSQLVVQHQDEFPVRVRVSRGFYGTSDKWSISEGEYFTIHFVKYTKVVGASDGCFGRYTIPINSSAQFGFVYSPAGKLEDALVGYTYKTAGEVMLAKPLPHLMRASKTWRKISGKEQTVIADDLLHVKKVKGRIKHFLKCTSLITGEEKLLPSNCEGCFTTNPSSLKLFLPQVLQYIPLPSPFVIYINSSDVPRDMPTDMFSHCVSLSHCSIETSLIATQLDSRVPMDSSPLIEIPIDLDISVELVSSKKEEVAQMYEETHKIYRNFSVQNLQIIPANAPTMDCDETTTEAFAAVHKAKEDVGVEILEPPRYQEPEDNKQPRSRRPTMLEDDMLRGAASQSSNRLKSKQTRQKLTASSVSEEKLIGLEVNMHKMELALSKLADGVQG